MNKNIQLNKENLTVENGKVIIDSKELAQAIESQDFNVEQDEEAEKNNCNCLSIF